MTRPNDLPAVRRRLLLQAAAASALAPTLSGCFSSESQAAPAGPMPAMGTNLSGMEWAQHGIRRGGSTQPNLHFTAPRKADIAWLAANGFKKNRLPVLWEMLQPVLFDARPNAATRAVVGEPGEFHPLYAQLITETLDAHAAVGATCILDLHNYCRYRDFRYAADGSVPGLQKGQTALHSPYTENPAGVQERIFSLAPNATLTQAHFADFWTRAAQRWKDHPGLAGWGLMNEPHDLPAAGSTEPTEGRGEDLAIWPAYARAGVAAIRKVERKLPIYVASNQWSAAMSLPEANPGFPLQGENLVYEVHLYLDATSGGHAFDYDAEVRKGFSAGVGRRAIDADTGVKRLEPAVRWARKHDARIALTEIGMPVDDARWQVMFQNTVTHALRNGVEVMSWMGGSHWPIRSHPINHVPNWYQNRTLEPAVAGPMKLAAGIASAMLFDEATAWPGAGQPVTVTVTARGALTAPLSINVAASDGARLSSDTLTLPAGANTGSSFTVVPAPDRVATLTYTAAAGVQVPPPRKVYAFADPAAQAGARLADAAHAVLARYSACKWDMADAYDDYLQGNPARDGGVVRAVADSGFGSSVANPMEMLSFVNTDDTQAAWLKPPVLRMASGRKVLDCTGEHCTGLWCKKAAPEPAVRPYPRSRVPYHLHDDHFALALVIAPAAGTSGTVFQASKAEDPFTSELSVADGQPQARWIDGRGQQVALTAPGRLEPGRPTVLALTSMQGAQVLRVDGEVAGRASATFAPTPLSQLLIGAGFLSWYPREGFRGHIVAAIAGRGRPSDAELAVLQRYLRSLAA
ncbi:MAG: glycoside hydrolase family 5 protein [Ramlibacter sp.]